MPNILYRTSLHDQIMTPARWRRGILGEVKECTVSISCELDLVQSKHEFYKLKKNVVQGANWSLMKPYTDTQYENTRLLYDN
jgi:hypothetical protein